MHPGLTYTTLDTLGKVCYNPFTAEPGRAQRERSERLIWFHVEPPRGEYAKEAGVTQIAEILYHVQGDIGGIGVSRLRFVRQDAGTIMGADVNAAAAAARGLFNSIVGSLPSGVSWTCDPQCNVYDFATGLVQGPLVVSSLPAVITGGVSGNFTAGIGARINWKTSTLVGRRLLKGATYMIPLAFPAYSSSGAVGPGLITAANAGAAGYLTAMTTALLYPVVWHRPAKGTFTGGMTGIIHGGVTSAVPAGLRSRRS